MDATTIFFAAVGVILRSACLPWHLGALLLEFVLSRCSRHRAPPRHVLITGAASGMGRGLAIYYATQPATRCLSLTDLNTAGLEETRAACAAAARSRLLAPGDDTVLVVSTACVDVTDAAAMRAFVDECDAPPRPQLDLVLCVAGVIEPRVGGGRALDDVELGLRALVNVNVLGMANTVLPALEIMRRRGKGQIGVLSSLGALDGLNALYPAYAASKAFATTWVLGLRARLLGSGVTLNVFSPGAVATPLLQPPPGIDPRYDPTSFAPSWIVHAPCIEIGVEQAAAAWAAGLAKDEAMTRPHRCYALACTDPCLDCPLDARDLIVRSRCHVLWGWRVPADPRHAWLIREPPSNGPVLGTAKTDEAVRPAESTGPCDLRDCLAPATGSAKEQ